MEIRRGDIVIASGPGDYSGKPRPFIVVQSDAFIEFHASLSLCPVTSRTGEPLAFRIPLAPTEESGLRVQSEAQVDKVQTLRRSRIEGVAGSISAYELALIDEALRTWFDL